MHQKHMMLGYPGHCGTFFRECPQCYYCTDTTLLECSTGRHLNLPGAPIAVGAQCGGTTHLPPATARPHHRCVSDTTLAVRPRTRAVQDRSANVILETSNSSLSLWLIALPSSSISRYLLSTSPLSFPFPLPFLSLHPFIISLHHFLASHALTAWNPASVGALRASKWVRPETGRQMAFYVWDCQKIRFYSGNSGFSSTKS